MCACSDVLGLGTPFILPTEGYPRHAQLQQARVSRCMTWRPRVRAMSEAQTPAPLLERVPPLPAAESAAEPIIVIDELSKSYGSVLALDRLSLRLDAGAVGLLG